MDERIVCLDIGDVRIGIAVSDMTRTIASPVEVLTRKGWGPDTAYIKSVCDRYETSLILSGLPLNMDGTEGFQAQKVRQFCEQLEKAGLTVCFQDERLTTVTAENSLLEDNMHRRDRKRNVDKVAAAIILQQWLDSLPAYDEPAAEPPENEYKEETTMENENEFIELIDENGDTVPFEHLATLEYEDAYYIALMPAESAESDDEEGEVVFMKIDTDEDGNECYTVVEDEETQAAVFEKFLEMMNEDQEYDEGED